MLVFEGDFANHDFRVLDAQKKSCVAQAGRRGEDGEDSSPQGTGADSFYQVRVAKGYDAGLVMLCCLAMDHAD